MLIKAKRGEPDAQYAIANQYWEGIGIQQSRTLGYTWTMVAAHHKNKMAMMTLEFGGMLKCLTTAKKEFAKILTAIKKPQQTPSHFINPPKSAIIYCSLTGK